jgi:hypothetical protein
VTWILAGFVALGVLIAAAIARRRWVDRAKADPDRDPAAARVPEIRKAALEALLVEPIDPADVVVRALALCAVDDVFSWRAGLRRLDPLLARLPDTDEGHALRAEVALQLGEIERARQLVAGAAPDHWRACGVRAALYELDGDVERAESARVAALLLAPGDVRAEPTARLQALRRRHRRRPSPTEQLWERVR